MLAKGGIAGNMERNGWASGPRSQAPAVSKLLIEKSFVKRIVSHYLASPM